MRSLNEYFKQALNTQDSLLRTLEDAILFEMSRRYCDLIGDDHQSRVEGWKLYSPASLRVFLNHNSGDSYPLWRYEVEAASPDHLRLGVFDGEEAARKFISDHQYQYANDGQIVEIGE